MMENQTVSKVAEPVMVALFVEIDFEYCTELIRAYNACVYEARSPVRR